MLELLNNKTYENIIQWQGNRAEFMLVDVKLWGARKNNPNMNYEKLSRAIRDKCTKSTTNPIPILSKVKGQDYVYKFMKKIVN